MIENTVTGQYYYGSRTANVRHNRLPVDDLWKCYFTSSRDVKRIIKEFGNESFVVKVVFESTDLDEVYWVEQSLIKQYIEDPQCINKKYQDKDSGHEIFSTAGKISWNKGLPSLKKGITRSPEIKAKISEARKGKGLGIAPSNKGIPMSPERYDLHMAAISKRRSYAGENNHFFGKTHSPEIKALIAANTSKAQKGKPKTKKACPHCEKLYAPHLMSRHRCVMPPDVEA